MAEALLLTLGPLPLSESVSDRLRASPAGAAAAAPIPATPAALLLPMVAAAEALPAPAAVESGPVREAAAESEAAVEATPEVAVKSAAATAAALAVAAVLLGAGEKLTLTRAVCLLAAAEARLERLAGTAVPPAPPAAAPAPPFAEEEEEEEDDKSIVAITGTAALPAAIVVAETGREGSCACRLEGRLDLRLCSRISRGEARLWMPPSTARM